MWTLYYAPMSCSLASHIALEQAGARYTAERVDFTKNAQRSAEYLKVNPKGRVPALVTEHGVNHVDTAASYGESELRLRPWLVANRSAVFLATKTGERDGPSARAELERSLERLGVDRVDLIVPYANPLRRTGRRLRNPDLLIDAEAVAVDRDIHERHLRMRSLRDEAPARIHEHEASIEMKA